jgi:hypothetical protein
MTDHADAFDDGINPRFMLAATRLRLNERRQADERARHRASWF